MNKVRWAIAFIGFGSNVGDRQATIFRALSFLKKSHLTTVLKVSSLYETEPVGYTKQDNFLNGVVAISTRLTPIRLLWFLHGIEQRLGRTRDLLWGPRTIDLDILLFENLVLESEELIIPHPEIKNRRFVLEPLAEIAANTWVPGAEKNVKHLLADVLDKSGVRLYMASAEVEHKLNEV